MENGLTSMTGIPVVNAIRFFVLTALKSHLSCVLSALDGKTKDYSASLKDNQQMHLTKSASDLRVVRFAANLPRDARQHIHLFNFEVRRISHNMLIHQTKAGDQPVIHRGTYREIFSSGPGWYRFANRIGHARSLFPGHLYVII